MTVYPTESQGTTGAEPRPSRMLLKGIAKFNDEVGIEPVARRYTELSPFGGKAWFVGRCANPDHADRTPSFYIYPPGRYHCYGCGVHGAALDLFMLCEGWPEDGKGEALQALAERYGVVLPRRPERWHARQAEKTRTREAAKRHVAAVYQRRLTRLYAPLVLVGGETPEQELRELEELAAALWPVSLDMAERRVSGEE